MGAFELDRGRERRQEGIGELAEDRSDSPSLIDRRRVREECIIALKVYDHCRHPYCKIHMREMGSINDYTPSPVLVTPSC